MLCSKTFSKDLCKTLLAANILLNNDNNKDFHLLIEKYTIPDESALRNNYMFDIYVEIMNTI